MQINVSQHQYFLALQSPCREKVQGQLSIIGPQLINEEWLTQERERVMRRWDAKEILGVREQGLWVKQEKTEERNWQNTQMKKEGAGGALIHVLHIHDCCCVCIPALSLSAIFALSSLSSNYLWVHLSCIHSSWVWWWRHITEDMQLACKHHALLFLFILI